MPRRTGPAASNGPTGVRASVIRSVFEGPKDPCAEVYLSDDREVSYLVWAANNADAASSSSVQVDGISFRIPTGKRRVSTFGDASTFFFLEDGGRSIGEVFSIDLCPSGGPPTILYSGVDFIHKNGRVQLLPSPSSVCSRQRRAGRAQSPPR